MYVCIYVRMYVGMYVRMYLRTYVGMYVCMYYVCIYVRMYVGMYVRMYLRTYVGMYVCTYVCIYVRMYVCTYLRSRGKRYSRTSSGVARVPQLVMETAQRAGRCGFRTRLVATDIFLPLNIQTGSGAHPTSCSISTVFLFPGYSGRNLQLTSDWICTSAPPICRHGVDRERSPHIGCGSYRTDGVKPSPAVSAEVRNK